MKLLAKFGILGLLAGGTATAVHGDPEGGWLSPNGTAAGAQVGRQATAAGGQAAGAVSGQVGGTVSATGSGAAVTGTATVGVGVTMSLADVQARVHELHVQTRADARHVQHLQLIARREKDVIKLNCVNDKLVQLKPHMNIADASEVELESAKDSDRPAIFDTISQAASNVRKLREEADQCIGEPITTAESSNSFTGPKESDDPTKGGFGDGDIEPPGYASPYN